jgi:hypothetical protein
MANRKISDLTALTAPATGDLLPIVDISEAAAADKNKKITYGELLASAPAGSAAAPSFSFDGDPNTGIYNPAVDTLAFVEGGVEVMRIDSSGRVGIGTTGPNRKLEVSDASVDNFIRVNSNGATKTGIEFASDGTVYSQLYFNNVAPYDFSLLQQYSTGSLVLGTNNTERARIDSSGRLLVGTSSDSGGALFQVNGDRIRVGTAKTPASASATGTAGEIAWDANYIYVCTATNTWKRSAIATW